MLSPLPLGACLLVTASTACGPKPLPEHATTSGVHNVWLTSDRTSYTSGDEIVFRLDNRSQHEVGYNFCGSQVERFGTVGWRALPAINTPCTTILYQLGANSVAEGVFRLKASSPATRYRVRGRVFLGGDDKEILSNVFVVNE